MNSKIKERLAKNHSRNTLPKSPTRDYLRALASILNGIAGITYDTTQLNSFEMAEEYIIDLVEKLAKGDNIEELEKLKSKYEKLGTDFYDLTERCGYLEEDNEELEKENTILEMTDREKTNRIKDLEVIIDKQKRLFANICIENSEKEAEIKKFKNIFNEKNKFAFKLDLIASGIKVIILFCACLLVAENFFSKILTWFF